MELAQHPVLASLIPVCLLVGAGWLAGRMRWVGPEAVRGLSNLVFMLLIPALLFRTMSAVRFEQLDPRPVLAYFPVALPGCWRRSAGAASRRAAWCWRWAGLFPTTS